MNSPDFDAVQRVCDRLLSEQQSLLLSSRRLDGDTDISYAPFVREAGVFYIFVSSLAAHTRNLQSHPKVSVLFIQPESEADNAFARQRLTFDCEVRAVAKDDNLYNCQLDAMQAKFGAIVSVLRTLPDFRLLALTPTDGRLVAGFGQTYSIDGQGRVQQP